MNRCVNCGQLDVGAFPCPNHVKHSWIPVTSQENSDTKLEISEEKFEGLTEEMINTVDKSGVPTIDERAIRVFKFLKQSEFTTWDITCFAVQYIAGLSLNHPILSTSAHVVNRWLYLCHYINHGFKEEKKL